MLEIWYVGRVPRDRLLRVRGRLSPVRGLTSEGPSGSHRWSPAHQSLLGTRWCNSFRRRGWVGDGQVVRGRRVRPRVCGSGRRGQRGGSTPRGRRTFLSSMTSERTTGPRGRVSWTGLDVHDWSVGSHSWALGCGGGTQMVPVAVERVSRGPPGSARAGPQTWLPGAECGPPRTSPSAPVAEWCSCPVPPTHAFSSYFDPRPHPLLLVFNVDLSPLALFWFWACTRQRPTRGGQGPGIGL